jgi:hypothetical protein
MQSRYNAKTIITSASQGRVVAVPRRPRVAIIGAAEGFQSAPFHDSEWEIWSCNSLWSQCKDQHGDFRADRWFELHPLRVQTAPELDLMQRCPIPLYTLRHLGQEFPTSVRFPFEAVEALWPRGYFTCTFAYQIALAIVEKFTTIGLFGVEFIKGTSRERTVERACVDFWVGLAHGRGVQIVTSEHSALAWSPHLYGYEYREELAEVETTVDGVMMARLMELERNGDIAFMNTEHEGTA